MRKLTVPVWKCGVINMAAVRDGLKLLEQCPSEKLDSVGNDEIEINTRHIAGLK